MGPQQAWKELLEVVERRDTKTVRDRALSLIEWLALGGFPSGTNNNTSDGYDELAENGALF